MYRFISYADGIGGEKVEISGQDAVHLFRVLRLRKGDLLEICDGAGKLYLAELHFVSPDKSIAIIKKELDVDREPETMIYLAQALVKGDKMDTIIQKGTELGVSCFIPYTASRCIVNLKGEKADKKFARWGKITKEAVKQCGRTIIPKILPPIEFPQLLELMKDMDLVLLFWEKENKIKLKEALGKLEKAARKIMIVIGPEGGFADEEVLAAKEKGVVTVGMGPRILRTETAAIAAVSIVLYSRGDMDY